MNSASRRASFHAAPVVVIADRREHMISPAVSLRPHPRMRSLEAGGGTCVAPRSNRRHRASAWEPPMTAAYAFAAGTSISAACCLTTDRFGSTGKKEERIMRKHLVVLASMALLVSAGVASAQQQTPKQYDSSGAPQPQQDGTRTGPAATMPDASGAATSGQAPARSQMPAEKDSSGAPKPTPAPGDVRK